MRHVDLQIHIVPGGDLPIYRQIMRQMTHAIAGGRLCGGDRMPSQRELAEQLVISPLTVKKAYDELENRGLIWTKRGSGTFVEQAVGAAEPEAQRESLRGGARRLLQQALLLGVPFVDVETLLCEVNAELDAERELARDQRSPVPEDRIDRQE